MNCSNNNSNAVASPTDNSVLAWIKRRLTCCVCKQIMSEPVVLNSCRHCLCYPCVSTLRKVARGSEHGVRQGVNCSVCGSFSVEDEDIRESTFLDDLKKIYDLLNAKPKPCTMCDEPTPSTHFCCNCQTHLCSKCLHKVHNRMLAATGAHDVIALKDDSPQDNKLKIFDRFLTCRLHNGKPLVSLCIDCNSLACAECVKTGHPEHVMKGAEDASLLLREKNEQLLDDISDLERQLQEKVSGQDAHVETSKFEKSIRERADELRERIDGDAMQALQQLNNKNKLQEISLAHAQVTSSELLVCKNDIIEQMAEAGAHGDSMSALCNLQQHLHPQLRRLHNNLQDTLRDVQDTLDPNTDSQQQADQMHFSFPGVVNGNTVALPVSCEKNSTLWPFNFDTLLRPLELMQELVLASSCDGFIKSETYALSRNEAWVPSQNAGIMSLFCRPLTKDQRQRPHWH